MASDPNLTYKTAFRELTEKLGRLPTTSDSEYWQLPGSPSAREGKKWTSVETAEQKSDSVTMSEPGHTEMMEASPTGAIAPTGASDSQERALANPGAAVSAPEAVSLPEANFGALLASQEAQEIMAREAGPAPEGWVPGPPQRLSQSLSSYRVGARGPGGGMVAKCEGCGELWEREKRRGRPAYKCPTCR